MSFPARDISRCCNLLFVSLLIRLSSLIFSMLWNEAIQKFLTWEGKPHWEAIAQHVGTRNVASCKSRFKYYYKEKKKKPASAAETNQPKEKRAKTERVFWSDEEKRDLLKYHELYHGKWKEIARHFTLRGANQIRWYYYQNRDKLHADKERLFNLEKEKEKRAREEDVAKEDEKKEKKSKKQQKAEEKEAVKKIRATPEKRTLPPRTASKKPGRRNDDEVSSWDSDEENEENGASRQEEQDDPTSRAPHASDDQIDNDAELEKRLRVSPFLFFF